MPASVSFASAGHGWVLGDAPCATPPCTSILRTRDGGKTWHGIPAPKAPTRPRPGYGASAGNASGLSQIRFANDVDGWALGNLLYSTHDGGATWVQQPFAGGEGSGGVNIEALEASASRVTALAARCPQPGSCETIEEFRSAVDHDDWRSAGMLTGANQQVTTLASHGSARFALIGPSLYSGTGDAGLRPRGSPCGNAPGSSLSPDGLAVADETHLDVICAGNGAMGHADNQLVGSPTAPSTERPPAPPMARLATTAATVGRSDARRLGVAVLTTVVATSVVIEACSQAAGRLPFGLTVRRTAYLAAALLCLGGGTAMAARWARRGSARRLLPSVLITAMVVLVAWTWVLFR